MLVLEGQGLLNQGRERACDQVTRPSRLYLGTAHVTICLSVCHPPSIHLSPPKTTIHTFIHSHITPPSFFPSLTRSSLPSPPYSLTNPLMLSVADPKP